MATVKAVIDKPDATLLNRLTKDQKAELVNHNITCALFEVEKVYSNGCLNGWSSRERNYS